MGTKMRKTERGKGMEDERERKWKRRGEKERRERGNNLPQANLARKLLVIF